MNKATPIKDTIERRASGTIEIASCQVDRCGSAVRTRGLCSKHYARVLRHGSTDALQSWRDQTEQERFWSKVIIADPEQCWMWNSEVNRSGYGVFSTYLGRRTRARYGAHRYSYMLTYGAIGEGLLVMHSCDNPPCVNPAHLSVGTPADNIRDGLSRGRPIGRRKKVAS